VNQGKAAQDGKKLKRVDVANPDTLEMSDKEKAIYEKVSREKNG
jgi:hypothetical protein